MPRQAGPRFGLPVAGGPDTTLRPPVLIRFVWWASAIPCVIALADPVVANSPPGPGATFVAARYYEEGLSRGLWTCDNQRRGWLTIVRCVKPEYPPRINGIRGVAQGLTSESGVKPRLETQL